MTKQLRLSSVLLTLLALAIVYGLSTTFINVEIERLFEHTITPYIVASPKVEQLNHAVFSGIDEFMSSRHVRLIGYGCFAIMVTLAVTGLITQKRGLASIGSISFILTIYAYFVIHMSFLAGLGILSALWLPFWGKFINLGDIAYLPYMILVYPFSLVGIDIRLTLAGTLISLGLLVFILGILTWFYARFQGKSTADFWIYRCTRHPQYLGWIVWSYGLMLRASLSRGIALQNTNPGASLPWILSTLIIICIALSEESRMARQHGSEYVNYQASAPFMLPLPGFLSQAIAAPFKLFLKKERPTSGWDLLWIFIIYLVVIMALSSPFVLFDLPSGGNWSVWPF
jgi:protein-S-isoprenylcysteine O-methyltransferase Ste14